jgi:hypothetical protein
MYRASAANILYLGLYAECLDERIVDCIWNYDQLQSR